MYTGSGRYRRQWSPGQVSVLWLQNPKNQHTLETMLHFELRVPRTVTWFRYFGNSYIYILTLCRTDALRNCYLVCHYTEKPSIVLCRSSLAKLANAVVIRVSPFFSKYLFFFIGIKCSMRFPFYFAAFWVLRLFILYDMFFLY